MYHRKAIAIVLTLLAGATLAYLAGCTPDTELSGTPIPNAMPDTYISGQPPSLLEASFLVHFYWTGSDPDNSIVGYHWKMSNNGVDGISIQDTLTIDPATGDTLNPWRFTTATDTIFVVSAELPQFPGDADLDTINQRNYQTHTLFVRSVDEMGGVDPTPAFLSFTATTLLPTIVVDRPQPTSNRVGGEYEAAPPTVTFGWTGNDPDYELGVPIEVRYLWKQALYSTPASPPYFNTYLRTWYEFSQKRDELVSFADSAWSNWIPYEAQPEERTISFPNQPMVDDTEDRRQITYIFAIQARDIAGAVSIDRVYGRDVRNVYISSGMTPLLEVEEPQLGLNRGTGLHYVANYDIAAGQELEYTWAASADAYAGQVTGYRYGWDVGDPNDDNDVGWALQRGLSPQHLLAPIRSFPSGNHTLTVQCWDNSDQLSRVTINLSVVPVPAWDDREQLLLIDDVLDRNSQAWPAMDGFTPLDRDPFRDSFWAQTLEGQGGVVRFFTNRDVIDTEDARLTYRDIVDYKVVIWTTRYAVQNFIWNTFKPLGNGDTRFIWLRSYQEQAGNLFLIGDRVLNQFCEERRWMLPFIFDTNETIVECGADIYSVGFGTRTLPDGSTVRRGRERYPWRSIGLSVVDHMTPKYNVYPTCGLGSVGDGARGKACVGVKGLILDQNFKSVYMPDGVDFPDTIFTDTTIDWKDLSAAYRDSLEPYAWGGDEFYNANLTQRSTPWAEQFCDGVPCIDPMFRAYSRFDWNQDIHIANGDNAWPSPAFGSEDINIL